MPSSIVTARARFPLARDAIERRSTRDIVAENIASAIASGLLPVGDALPGERDLAAALQVSRETVRGGMQILAARGIIEISHGARARVVNADVGSLATGLREPAAVNRYDLESIHQARLLVERTVVAEAARRVTDEILAYLEGSLEAQRATIDDPVRFLMSDREFHFAIYRASGNAVLADFVGDLYTYMLDYRRKVMSRPGAIAKSYEDHVAIVAALRARDPAAVIAAFDVHLDRIHATTRSVMGVGDRPYRGVRQGAARRIGATAT